MSSGSPSPRALRKANVKNMKFVYYNNGTVWQNRSTFGDWLRAFDHKMHGRRVLLLLDNASSHAVTQTCYNVKIKFLPPNMTAHIQPLDAGRQCAICGVGFTLTSNYISFRYYLSLKLDTAETLFAGY